MARHPGRVLSRHAYRLHGGDIMNDRGRHAARRRSRLACNLSPSISSGQKRHAARRRRFEGLPVWRSTVLVCLSVLVVFGFARLAIAAFSSRASGEGEVEVASLSAPADVSVSVPGSILAGPLLPLAALDDVEQTSPAVTALEVSWAAVAFPSGGTGGYYVQRYAGGSTTPSDACGTSPSSLLSSSATSCTDTGLTPGTSYQYQVVAVYDSWSAPSAMSSAMTLSASTLTSFTLTPSTSAPTASTGFTVTVTALDQYGNTDAAYTGPQCVTFSGPDDAPGNIALLTRQKVPARL